MSSDEKDKKIDALLEELKTLREEVKSLKEEVKWTEGKQSEAEQAAIKRSEAKMIEVGFGLLLYSLLLVFSFGGFFTLLQGVKRFP